MRAKKRIETIAALIENVDLAVDVGADHGYLAKMLVEKKKARKVIATDISEKSLQKTVELCNRFNLSNIETRVGDGIEPVKNEVIDVCVIAGMGGYEIIKILDAAKHTSIKQWIFQPAQNTIELRRYLKNNNFKILKDFIVKDQNKFYNTLVVEKSQNRHELNELEIRYGLTNFDLCSVDFIEYLMDKLERINKTLESNKSEKLENEKREVLTVLAKMKEKIK